MWGNDPRVVALEARAQERDEARLLRLDLGVALESLVNLIDVAESALRERGDDPENDSDDGANSESFTNYTRKSIGRHGRPSTAPEPLSPRGNTNSSEITPPGSVITQPNSTTSDTNSTGNHSTHGRPHHFHIPSVRTIGLYLVHRHSAKSSPTKADAGPASLSSNAPSTSMTSPNSWIHASLHLDGSCIRSASVEAKVHRTASTKTSMSPFSGAPSHLHLTHAFGGGGSNAANVDIKINNPDFPWIIQQVQDAHVRLVQVLAIARQGLSALSSLASRSGTPTSFSSDGHAGTINVNQQEQQQQQQEYVANMFERFPAELQAMVDLLFEAREIMSSPNQVAFPQAKASVLPQEMFSPPLPDDIVVEFNVLGDEVIVTVLSLQQLDKPPENPSLKGDTWFMDNRSWIGKKFIVHNTGVEVLDHAEVRFTVYTFQQALAAINDAFELASGTLAKFKALHNARKANRLAMTIIDNNSSPISVTAVQS